MPPKRSSKQANAPAAGDGDDDDFGTIATETLTPPKPKTGAGRSPAREVAPFASSNAAGAPQKGEGKDSAAAHSISTSTSTSTSNGVQAMDTGTDAAHESKRGTKRKAQDDPEGTGGSANGANKVGKTDGQRDAATERTDKKTEADERARRLAQVEFHNPNKVLDAWAVYYKEREKVGLEWGLVKAEKGKRKDQYKPVLFIKDGTGGGANASQQGKKYRKPATFLSPFVRTVDAQGPPYGDWKTEVKALQVWRPNQEAPVEAQYKFGIGVKPWDERIENPNNPNQATHPECPDAADFVDRFMPFVFRDGIRYSVRQREFLPKVLGWYNEYARQYKVNPSQSLEDYVVDNIIQYKMTPLDKKAKPNDDNKRLPCVYVPRNPETGDLMDYNRRIQLRNKVCGLTYPDDKGKKAPGQVRPVRPELTSDPFIAKVPTFKDKEGHPYKYLHYPIMSAHDREQLPFEQAVINSGDVAAHYFTCDFIFHIDEPCMRVNWTGAVVWERRSYQTPEEEVRATMETSFPGSKPLAAPQAPPPKKASGGGAGGGSGSGGGGISLSSSSSTRGNAFKASMMDDGPDSED